MEILATAPARLWLTEQVPSGLDDYTGELNWVAERLGGSDDAATRAMYADGHAVMGMFSAGAGQVFTTGCTDWAYGLGQPDVDTVTRNLLARFIG